jgi:SAM-dependent methyltransferase
LYARAFGGVAGSRAHLEQTAVDALDPVRSREQLDLVERVHGSPLRGEPTLEIGAGLGVTLAVAGREYGWDARGIEPGDREYDGSLAIGRDLLVASGIDPSVLLEGLGEELPFRDNTFEAVYSSNVLEHVHDPDRVLAEAIRVARPGGLVQFVFPNYGSWWEGHYGVLWIPGMPRWMARIYLIVRRRQTAFLDSLHFLDARWARRAAARHSHDVALLGTGVDLWEARVRGLSFGSYAALGRLKRMLRLVHRLGLVGPLISVGRALHWQTPIVLSLRKREGAG